MGWIPSSQSSNASWSLWAALLLPDILYNLLAMKVKMVLVFFGNRMFLAIIVLWVFWLLEDSRLTFLIQTRLMEPLLLSNPYRDSRVVWISSMHVESFDPHDHQLRHAKHAYQFSKYQIDLISTSLSRMATKKKTQDDRASICHVLAHPGACHTDILHPEMFPAVLAFFIVMAKLSAFFWVCMVISPSIVADGCLGSRLGLTQNPHSALQRGTCPGLCEPRPHYSFARSIWQRNSKVCFYVLIIWPSLRWHRACP